MSLFTLNRLYEFLFFVFTRVCEGRANPADVLREQIDKYRQVFIVTANQIQKLDDAMTKYFGAPGSNPPPPPPPPAPPSGPFGDRTNRNQPAAAAANR